MAVIHLVHKRVIPAPVRDVQRSLPPRAGCLSAPRPPRNRVPAPVILDIGAAQKLLLRGSGLATRRPTRGPINATGEQVALFRTSGKRSASGLRLTS